MTFKSTKCVKIMTDAKKHGVFDNIRFPQLRFHCKYYKKKKKKKKKNILHIEVSVLRQLAKIHSDI